ncbi:MAG: exodeoxyribonuclease V subunit beta [Gemmatimonadaceae bacterium]|nr:exodeoxyribonuclease V subunit beta [Gemmatimonadaceae bacterium]
MNSPSRDRARTEELERFRVDQSPFASGISLIEASAGTGKTYNIAMSVVRLLLARTPDGAWMVGGLENILVVTFTKAATSELVTRIRDVLRQAHRVYSGLEPNTTDERAQQLLEMAEGRLSDAAGRLQDAVQSLDRLAVFTIHGFCKRVLDEYALESGTPFGAALLEDEQDIVQRAAHDWWRRRVYMDSLVAAYVTRQNWAPDVFLNDYRLSQRVPGVRLDPDRSLEAERAAVLQASAQVARIWDSEEAEHLLADVPFKKDALLGSATRRATLWSEIESAIRTDVETLPALLAPLGVDALVGAVSRSTKKGKDAAQALADWPIAVAVSELETALVHFEQALRVDAVYSIARAVAAEKERRQALGFDDLLGRLSYALRMQGPGGQLAKEIRRQFHAALIDEFQDTDQHQFEIFSTALTDCPLFLIGDPKQAIYAFRGADVHAYLDAAATADRRFTLDRNFRSTSGMVSAVNALFQRHPTPFIDSAIAFHPTTAAKSPAEEWALPGGSHALHWLFIPHNTNKKGEPEFVSATEARRLLYAACVRHIVHNLSEGWPAGRLAVLVRTTREGVDVAAELRNAGVPAVVAGLGDVMASAEARELQLVLEGIATPRHVRRLRAAMATQLWGVSHEELVQLAAPESETAWTQVADEVEEWRTLWNVRGLLPMLQAWFASRTVTERLLALPDGERQLTNVRHLVELLHAASISHQLNIEGTLHWLATHIEDATGGSDTAAARQREPGVTELRLESDASAVQIVTVHRSKGLEYDVVYCPTLWGAYPVGDDEPVLVREQDGVVLDHGSSQFTERQRAADRERLAEECRLLYVALTRARFRTVLGWGPISQQRKPVSAHSALSYLLCGPVQGSSEPADVAATLEATPAGWESLLKSVVASHPEQMALEVVDTLHLSRRTEVEGDASADFEPRARSLPITPAPADRFDTYRIASFTSLTRTKASGVQPIPAIVRDVDGDTPADPESVEPRARDLPRNDFRSFPAGRRAGVVLHALFEHAEFAAKRSELTAQVAAHLTQEGMADTAHDERIVAVVDMMERTHASPIPAAQSFALRDVVQTHAQHEWQFLLPMARQSMELTRDALANAFEVHGSSAAQAYAPLLRALGPTQLHGYLTGFVDLLFAHEGRWWVVDWKSNQLGVSPTAYAPDALQQVMWADHYTLQYHLYLVAVHRYLRHRLPGYDYDQHVGGAAYAFLRGFGDFNASPTQGWYVDRPNRALIEALSAAIDPETAGPVS